MKVRILSARQVREALSMPDAIESARMAFRSLALDRASVPPRTTLRTSAGVTLFMPGYLAGDEVLAQKVVSVYGGNEALGLSTINGLVLLFDSRTGLPQAILDGGALTTIRTGAAAGLATDLLARRDSRVLTIFGAGGQAYDQVAAVCAVRQVEEVRIVSKQGVHCETLAEQLRQKGIDARSVRNPSTALQGADIVTCATGSSEPLFHDTDLAPGTHINAVGAFTPEMQEVPMATVARALVFVDHPASAMTEAGDLIKPFKAGLITQKFFDNSLGDLIVGKATGRTSLDQTTFFKSVGVVVQDLTAASMTLSQATAKNLGEWVDF